MMEQPVQKPVSTFFDDAVAWVRRLALRALGVDVLVAGLRRDLDAHADVIGRQADVATRTIDLLQQTRNVALSVNARLTYYEQTIDPIKRAFQSLRRRSDREQRRLEIAAKLAAGPADGPLQLEPPIEMSEDVAGA